MDDTLSLFPISIKGVVIRDGDVLLLKNHRGEWDLPGGRIEHGETSEECVVREIAEETRLVVQVGPILASGPIRIATTGKKVFVVTYGCQPQDDSVAVHSEEHMELGWFSPRDARRMDLRLIYQRSIDAWFKSADRSRTADTGLAGNQ
jgi:8-oxo-dGTP pyrophosphatase MutT (NUDIX family)